MKNRTHYHLLSPASQVQYADFSPEPGRETVSVSSAHVRLTQTVAAGGARGGQNAPLSFQAVSAHSLRSEGRCCMMLGCYTEQLQTCNPFSLFSEFLALEKVTFLHHLVSY